MNSIPHTPDGEYKWQEPSGGTAGPYTQKVTVRGGKVTLWQSVSGDGKYVITATEAQLTAHGDHFQTVLAQRIKERAASIDYRHFAAETPAELLPVQIGRRGWGWIPVTGRVGA